MSSGTLRPTFAADTTKYRAAVQYNVRQITVTATAATGVTVEYLDATDITLADADTNTNGHQVDLAVGETAFKVKVTSGTDTETYTVTVERNSAYLFGWTPTRDINALEAAGNADPQGIWSAGTTMWVADDEDDKLYAYTLATGARDASKDISLHTDNGDPQGIWSDETTIWVVDDGDDKLYAYTLSGGARDTSKEFSLHADNGDPAGIWSDGTTIWVANNKSISVTPYKVFAYTLSDGARDTDKEFAPSWNPVGIWAHGSTMWVISVIGANVGTRVNAYTIDLNPDGTAGPNHGRWENDKQFALRSPDGTSPLGIWMDGKGAVWITAPDSPKVESYHMLPFSAGSTTLSALTINDGTSDATLRPTFAATTLAYSTSVTDTVNRVTISATPSENTAAVDYIYSNGEALQDAASNILGFQVNVRVGQTLIQLLVTAQDGTALIHSVVVERDSTLPGGWTPTKDIVDLDPVALDYPRGIWSDGTTIWVMNNNNRTSAIYARTLATSARDATKEFPLDAANASPRGIWSDGTTIWVADNGADKLFAYMLSNGAREAAKDINLHANNGYPTDVWSDGTTVWITDSGPTNGGLYAYTLADGGRDISKEFALTANSSNTAIGGIWSDGTTVWVADTQARKLFAYVKDTGDPDGARDVNLSQVFPQGAWGQGSTIWVADPGPNISGSPARLHRIFSYRKPPSSPSDVTLSNLDVSPFPAVSSFTANLRPTFSFVRASYRVAVANQASRVTISATANNSTTPVAYLDANGDALVDADPNTTGFQVDVAVGETSIAIRLAAGGTALTYTVIVERDSAELYGWTPTKDLNNLLLDNPPLAGDAIRGVWADSTTFYVLPHNDPQVFAYTRASGARDEDKDIATNPGTLQENKIWKAGIWSNGTTMWVLNYGSGEDGTGNTVFDGSGKIYAYTLSTGERDTDKDFPLHLATTWAARGIWSDGTTVWVSDWKAASLLAYTLASGARAPDSDITLHHLNDAQGIWSDGTTIWVAQWESLKFFAYDLATGAYDPEKDFDRTPGNRYPRDVWSDGTTLYVPDHFDQKLFAYNMTEPAMDAEMDAELSALTLSGITLSPQFASSIYTYTYSADAATTLAETKVMATTNNSSAVAVIKLNGVVDTDGTVDLKLGENIITVEVTAADGMTMKTYTVTVTLEGTVSFESGEYYVSEGDAVEVTMVLSHALPRNATITFPLWTSDDGSMPDDYTVPETITFGANETSASFTITATQDNVEEDPESVLVFFTLPPSVENLTYGDPATTIVNIVDDDTPGMTITPTTLDVDEGGTATYTVKLNTVPTGNVDVEITSNDTGAATVSTASLTFTSTDWNTAQTVTVTGVEDSNLDNESVTLSNDPSGANYDSVSTVYLALNVADNDRTGVHVSKTSLTVLEEDTAGNSYTVALSRQPTADVTVTVAGHAGTDVTPSPATLTFTSLNWATAQTVTVKAGNDADTATDMVTLTHRAMSADSAYNGITIASLTVTVTDNDTRGVTVTPTSLAVNEGGTNTYTVVLDTQPTATVTVTVNDPTDNTDVTTNTASLTFTASNWDTEQTVTVSADEDDDSTQDTATVTHTVAGGDYDSFAASSVSVTVTDNDTPGVIVLPTSLTIDEGNTDTYTVELNTQPSGDVMVAISSNNTDVTVSSSPLTFTTTNWNSAQTVTVTAGQDADAADDKATLTHNPSGADYGSVSNAILMVTVTDDETAGVTVTPTSLTVNEGGTNTYTIVLDTEPTDTVTVAISSNNTDVTVSASPLTVWDTAVTVTVSAAEDADSTHDTATVTHTVTGGDYNFVINVIVTVTDNDTPGVTVTPLSLTIGEGSTGTYAVVLNTQPSGNVMVTIRSNNTDVTVPSSTLTFTMTDWNTEQTVTVTAGQDADAANDMATLTHNPSGGGYNSVSSVSLMVTVTDDEMAGVTVTPTSLTVNEGGTNTYTVVLDTQPTATVTVTIVDPTDNADVTANPASLRFSTSNWATAQTVTVSADEDDDPTQDTATVTHTVAGGDYASFAASSVAVTVTDNDTPGVTFTPMALTIGEGATGRYDVRAEHRAHRRT